MDEYFDANIADYGIFGEMGVDSLVTIAGNMPDEQFSNFVKGQNKTCSKKVFLGYVKEAHRSFNAVASSVVKKEISKNFTEEELKKMTAFYKWFYTPESRRKIKDMFKSYDLDDAIQHVATGFGQDKIKKYVEYKNSELGQKETYFTHNVTNSFPAYEQEFKDAKRPPVPDCLK